MKNGVPFDVAFAADPAWRLAAVVTFGEFDGAEFNWDSLTWRERR
ncbi:hypothetical protein [uncultured Alsobacter sp.]|nr:hypothetical protein [uncultured Alsobacter sp.]